LLALLGAHLILHVSRIRFNFDVVVVIGWPNYPENCAGGCVAADGAFHARQVKCDYPDQKE
jgi:hypothetical protein